MLLSANTLKTIVARKKLALVSAWMGLFLASCQGSRSEKPPVHIWHNMDFQHKFTAQEENPFFQSIDCPTPEENAEAETGESIELQIEAASKADLTEQKCFGRAMRVPPQGTVARLMDISREQDPDLRKTGDPYLQADDHYYRGRGMDGRLVDSLPRQISLKQNEFVAFVERGEERYNIYCQPCHDQTGGGEGIATRRGGGFKVQPATFHTDNLRAMPLGYFFDVITNGKGTMLPYASQIPVRDRWAIAVWVRTLQKSRTSIKALAMGGQP